METTPNDHRCDSSCSLSNSWLEELSHVQTKEWERRKRGQSAVCHQQSDGVSFASAEAPQKPIHPLCSSAHCSSVAGPLLYPSVSDASASSPRIMNYLMFLSSEWIISLKYSDCYCHFPLFHLLQSSVHHETLIRFRKKLNQKITNPLLPSSRWPIFVLVWNADRDFHIILSLFSHLYSNLLEHLLTDLSLPRGLAHETSSVPRLRNPEILMSLSIGDPQHTLWGVQVGAASGRVRQGDLQTHSDHLFKVFPVVF